MSSKDRLNERPPAGPVPGSGSSSSQAAGEDPDPVPPAGEAVEQDLDALLAEAQQQRDEYLDLAKRTKADFENYRKRVAADVQAAQVRGKSEVAREVIEAVDNLERALAAAGEGDAEGLAAGVEMVLSGLRDTLARNGVEAVDPTGEKFDPQWHEALSTAAAEGVEAGQVVEVMQKGYRLDGQLIRPARVVVSA
jgi:molecular chaperone GrpE